MHISASRGELYRVTVCPPLDASMPIANLVSPNQPKSTHGGHGAPAQFTAVALGIRPMDLLNERVRVTKSR